MTPRRPAHAVLAAVLGAALLAGCTSEAEPEPSDPVILEGEGFADAGPRYPGVFDVDSGRTDLDDDKCHAWVEVLPAGTADDDTQQYLVTFGLREPEVELEEGAEPAELTDAICIAERSEAIDRLSRRLFVAQSNLNVSLLSPNGARVLLR